MSIGVAEVIKFDEIRFLVQELTSFKTQISLNESLISLNTCDFKGWEKSKPSIHLGRFIEICSIGNSYKTLENMLFISLMESSSQFKGITWTLYLELKVLAKEIVSGESG